MAETWPAALPSMNLTGWKYSRASSILKSEMEIGPPKRRRRTTAQLAKVSGTLTLSAPQFEIFRNFVETDLNGGIEEIIWPEFIEGVQKNVVLDIDTNGDLYSVTQTGRGTFEVKLSLEIKP